MLSVEDTYSVDVHHAIMLYAVRREVVGSRKLQTTARYARLHDDDLLDAGAQLKSVLLFFVLCA